MEMTVDLTTIPEAEVKERLFQCSTCKRSFTRVDHLMRHVRSHTKQRPYVCPTCSKGFARVDLLKRHVANHSSDHSKKRQRTETVRQSRVVQACEDCSKNHLRCEDEKPCNRCRKKKISCRLPESAQNELDAVQQLGAAQDLLDLSNKFDPQQPQISLTHADVTASRDSGSIAQEAVTVASQHVSPPMHAMTANLQTAGALATHNSQELSFRDESALIFGEESPIDPFLPDYLRNMPPLENSLSGYVTPRGAVDFSFNWDLDFTSLDFSSLDQYSIQANFHEDVLSTDTQATEQQSHRRPPQDDAAVRAEVFKQSMWRYMPRSNTNPVIAEEPNLAFPDGENEDQSPSHIPSHRVTKEQLSYGARDKLLALVLSTSSPENLKQIAAGFPSLELLDGIVQIFLTAPSIDAASWFHFPTFSPDLLHSELLACIVAAGAFSAPDVSLQKLGLALQEASRVGIGKAFDDDNALIRDLQYLQVQLLQVEVGMWSGISRKMEIAESFLQPAVTMLRRGGRFGRSIWKKIVPCADEDGAILKEKWREWILQESWLRLVYRFFEFDRQSSMALLKPPLISYAEMKLPLPHPDGLWYAPSPSAWKSAFLSMSLRTTKRTTLYDCMEDLEHLNYHPVANLAVLYMIWGMVWEYRQSVALSAKAHLTSSLLLSSQHQELTEHCENFRVSSDLSSCQVEVILEAMLMHLNAPLNDLQTFAGIAGLEEARHAYPNLRDWVTTTSARQALWHSSQILRLSGSFPKGSLRNFYAMTVYHATLVLWVYGILQCSSDNSESKQGQRLVSLSGQESVGVKRFVKLNRGEPAVRRVDNQTDVPLSDQSRVIGLVLQLLRNNYEAAEGSCPPLVKSLIQLMEGLRSASK